MKSSLIILTRNEIEGLKSLIRKIPFSSVDEYFAVDYQSTDGTVEFFQQQKIPVIRQKKPGRAEAFRLGAEKAKGRYLIFFSPDGNEDPADIPKLIKVLDKGADLAIASRFLPSSRNEEDDKIFKWRKWANQAFTLAVNILWTNPNYQITRNKQYPMSNCQNKKLFKKLIIRIFNLFGLLENWNLRFPITDSINGYRAIKKSAFNKLRLDAEGFAIEYQMTIRALKLGLKIREIPTIEGERIGGKSGSTAIPTGIKFLYYLLREIIIDK